MARLGQEMVGVGQEMVGVGQQMAQMGQELAHRAVNVMVHECMAERKISLLLLCYCCFFFSCTGSSRRGPLVKNKKEHVKTVEPKPKSQKNRMEQLT